MNRLFRYAFSLPPHVAAIKALKWSGRLAAAAVRLLRDWPARTYAPLPGAPSLAARLKALSPDKAPPVNPALIRHYLGHRFDLLGSGWTEVAYGIAAKGFDGHAYPAAAAWNEDAAGRRLNAGNRARAAEIRALIGNGYAPIDWQIDFKSGFRWSERRPSKMIFYGHKPGADVKVPWELARLQHLPQLAIAYGAGGEDELKEEFRNQVLDFLAANPPRFGVNWSCAMDVAIRAANMCLGLDLFRAAGAEFDSPFMAEFQSALTAHGRHIRQNLEWHPRHRANHYLADICGLLFIAAYLPKSAETRKWMDFAYPQFTAEVMRQFTPDGANFEASTCYHRLSGEMAVYTSALVIGLAKEGEAPFPADYLVRLERIAEFTIHATKPDGHVVQVGDNDSGRFFNLTPALHDRENPADDHLDHLDHLDHRALVAAVAGLFDRDDFREFAGGNFAADSAVVRALSGGKTMQAAHTPMIARGRLVKIGPEAPPGGTETVIRLPDPGVLEGLVTAAYPDFGLYIFRSARFFMSIRSGPIGQNGNGGHAHNDQSAVELQIDGEDWLADPGTYVYTPAPALRDDYRSVLAHAAPRHGTEEPARLDLGLFRLEDRARAICLRFDDGGFHGVHHGFGRAMHRIVDIGRGRISIRDVIEPGGGETESVTVTSAGELRLHLGLSLPFSPGYGIRTEK